MAPGDMYNDHYPLIVPAPPDLSESRLRTGNELQPVRKDEQEDPLRLERDLLNPADKSLDPRLVSIFESAEGLQGLDRNDKSAFVVVRASLLATDRQHVLHQTVEVLTWFADTDFPEAPLHDKGSVL